jgi:aryl carrier-like protein
MPIVIVPFKKIGTDSDSRAQLEYALTFISEDVEQYRIDEASAHVEIVVACGSDSAAIEMRARELVARYEKSEFGLKKKVDFEQSFDRPVVDAWEGLLSRRLVTPIGEGHVILRGLAASLAAVVHDRIDRTFVPAFQSEREIYPPTILCSTLDRVNHFTSFPEHVDFVSHLRRDLEVINSYAADCKTNGWSPSLHEGRMAEHDFAISPSCCYHCYEGMEGWLLKSPGRSTTMSLACHRYEGANHRTLNRLRAFTMREVVWVGQPDYVIASRAKAEALIIEWAKDWQLSCSFETANDMFFTDDYAVKASFQRQQQAKRELRVQVPFEKQSISCFSSNFHSTSFGKAFNIRVDQRVATSGCIGWGIERWVYAIFSQFGFDPRAWPAGLQADMRLSGANLEPSDGRST